MKNLLKLFGIIALVVVIGFSMVACSDDNGDNGNSSSSGVPAELVATWYKTEAGATAEDPLDVAFIIDENGTVNVWYALSVSGSTITVSIMEEEEGTVKFAIDGKKLTLTESDTQALDNGVYYKH